MDAVGRCLSAVLAGIAALLTNSAIAAIITVSGTADTITADGALSLREAIQSINDANDVNADVTAGRTGPYGVSDTIDFDINGGGLQTISTATTLFLQKPMTINGYSQPGALAASAISPATIDIVLDGSGAMPSTTALFIGAGGSTVRGLAIERYPNAAIVLQQAGDNVVAGNYVGTDSTGTVAMPNHAGIDVLTGSTHNVIGGPTPADRNVVSGNIASSISTVSEGTLIEGNYIGTDAAGATALGGAEVGISFNPAVTYTDPVVIKDNLISGGGGVFVSGINLGTPANVVIQGNRIGTNASGTTALPNTRPALVIQSVVGNVLVGGTTGVTPGGPCTGACNLISGNADMGLSITNTKGVVIQGNQIGTDVTGKLPLGNAVDGIALSNRLGTSAENATIGRTASGPGSAPEAANIVAFNGRDGVDVGVFCNGITPCNNEQGNALLGNSIFGNQSLGIDLRPIGGPTANDPGDSDSGANDLQNFPVLSSAVISGVTNSHVLLGGSLNTTANTDVRLEFFSNASCQGVGPNDFGEGKTYLGFKELTTDGSGNATFVPGLDTTFSVAGFQPVFTATATSASGTSEFSKCLRSTVTSFTDATATGTGNATISFTGGGSGCTFSSAAFVDVSSLAQAPPPGAAFPHGLVEFSTTGCTPGATLEFTIIYPIVLPAGFVYLKFGETAGMPAHWYVQPGSSLIFDQAAFTVTDGGVGDDDLSVNGGISDAGGPSAPPSVSPVPTMPDVSWWTWLCVIGFGSVLTLSTRLGNKRVL